MVTITALLTSSNIDYTAVEDESLKKVLRMCFTLPAAERTSASMLLTELDTILVDAD